MTTESAWTYVERCIGRSIGALQRVFHAQGDTTDTEEGALQVVFTDGAVLRLEGGGDGETLKAFADAWRDPFAGPLKKGDEEWIKEHGRPVVVDVSGEEPYKSVVGKALADALPIRDSAGTLRGCQFILDNTSFSFLVDGDEWIVVWGRAHPDLRESRWVIG